MTWREWLWIAAVFIVGALLLLADISMWEVTHGPRH